MKSIRKLTEQSRYSSIIFRELVKTDFQLRYQGSILGILWSVFKPLMLFAVMYAVFVRFLHFSDGSPSFAISLLCGTSLWSFFSEATMMGMTSIVSRGDLLRKIHFPNYIMVASATMGSMISLGINLVVVILFGFVGHAEYTWRIILVPFSILQLYIIALGLALILSTMFVYFRDIVHIWEVVLQALFYAIPIIYPIAYVQKTYPHIANLMMLNPVAQTIMDVRHNLLAPRYVPTIWHMVHNPFIALIPYVISLALLWIGIHIFRRHSARFAEVL